MKTCTFFGHRDCPDTVRPLLQTAIERLICEEDVTLFYVGNQGQFDALVRSTLRRLQQRHPHICYGVVLPYLPRTQSAQEPDTMFPESLETVHPRYAIGRRNRWMLEQADAVICYVKHDWGGAARYVSTARRQGKTVIDLWRDL